MPPRHKLEATTDGSNMPATTVILLLGLFTVLRLGLVVGRSSLPSSITDVLYSPALSSALINPLYTMEHLREGNFLLDRSGVGTTGLDAAYEGSVFHLPPIILALFRPLFQAVEAKIMQEILIGTLIVIVDLVVAILIYQVTVFATCGNDVNTEREAELEREMDDKIRPKRAWKFGLDVAQSKDKSTEKIIQEPLVHMADLPQVCCLMYFCNPIAILVSSCTSSPSLQGVLNMSILIAVRISMPSNVAGAKWRALLSTLSLALAVYVEPHHVVYLLPMAIWLSRSNDGNQLNKGIVGATIASFCVWFGLLHGSSALLVEDYATVLAKTYGHVHGFVDMSPNMGLSWYFFIQIFDRFRRYFVALLNLLQFIFVAPLTIRLHNYPIVLTTAFFLLGTLFKPVQTLHDAALGLTLVGVAPRTIARMGNASLVSIFAIVVPATLVVMFYWLWLETGTGNANFMFFQCLAYNVFLSIITLDYISATVKRDKALRLMEKLAVQQTDVSITSKDKSD